MREWKAGELGAKPGVNVRREDAESGDKGEYYLRRRAEERKAELRSSLLSLKSMLEEVEAKARVCYLEVVEMLVEVDKGE